MSGEAPSLVDAPPSRAHLVVFWASWCPPCRAETPELVRLARDPVPGLATVVFGHDITMDDVHRFLRGPPEPRLNFRLDEQEAAAKAFGVSVLPTSFLVRDGRLVARFDGPRKWSSAGMRRLLERLIAEDAPRPGPEP